MDELIAKLRSQPGESQKPPDASQDDVPVLREDVLPLEISTSQSEALPTNRFKLDLNVLRKHRHEDAMRISEVKASDLLKISGPVWAIVKSIESYKGLTGCVYKWELMDESGVIFASSTVSDQNIAIGSVVCIADFSVWSQGGNHLNIVERNIKGIYT